MADVRTATARPRPADARPPCPARSGRLPAEQGHASPPHERPFGDARHAPLECPNTFPSPRRLLARPSRGRSLEPTSSVGGSVLARVAEAGPADVDRAVAARWPLDLARCAVAWAGGVTVGSCKDLSDALPATTVV